MNHKIVMENDMGFSPMEYNLVAYRKEVAGDGKSNAWIEYKGDIYDGDMNDHIGTIYSSNNNYNSFEDDISAMFNNIIIYDDIYECNI